MSLTQQGQQAHQTAMERAHEIRERLKVGITQTALAKELGISTKRLSQILNKYRDPEPKPQGEGSQETGNYEQLVFEFPEFAEEVEEPWECPTCGIQVQEGQLFCWKCGQDFDWGKSNAPK